MRYEGGWNYHPELPLRNTSVFVWPPNPRNLGLWVVRNWLTLSERVLLLILAVMAWALLYPALSDAEVFAPGWMAQVWMVNFALVFGITGALHLYFCILKSQGKELKFDKRDQARGNGLWNFRNQVHDNMFWILGSGVAQLTLFQTVTMWLMANGHTPTISFSSNPVWFIAFLIVIPIWSALHFYWVHRLLHVPFLYRRVHVLHHRNVNIGPWSGLSMHPVEHLIYFTSLCIHWVVASHPVHLIFHVLYLGPGAAMTHTGYEELLIKDKRRLALGTFYHQLHHRFYECNYGNQEMPWDRWFGTFHDGSDKATNETRNRKSRMYS